MTVSETVKGERGENFKMSAGGKILRDSEKLIMTYVCSSTSLESPSTKFLPARGEGSKEV